MLLLVADSTDDCAVYEPLTTSFDYSTDCVMGAAGYGTGGSSGTSGVGVGGTSGVGAAPSVGGTSGVGVGPSVGGTSGVGTSGASGSSGAAGSTAMRTGHVSLKISSDPDQADGAAYTALQSAGLNVHSASVVYRTNGECGGGEDGVGTVHGVNVTLGNGGLREFRCARLKLPVRDEQTVTCTEIIDAANPATCSLTFTPTPR